MAVTVARVPSHSVGLFTVTVGIGFTVTVIVKVSIQIFGGVPTEAVTV